MKIYKGMDKDDIQTQLTYLRDKLQDLGGSYDDVELFDNVIGNVDINLVDMEWD